MYSRWRTPSLLRLTFAIGVVLAMLGCADEDGPIDPGIVGQDREPAPANPIYVPPADRLDPNTAPTMTDAQFRQLGATRSGIGGHSMVLPATAETRHVSAARGADSGDGSMDSPWRTLQFAADHVGPNTTVFVDDSGPYAGGLVVRRGGNENAWVVFTSRDPGRPPLITGLGLQRDAIVDIDASYVVVHGFEIAYHDRGGLAEDEIGILVEPQNGDIHHVSLLNNHVHHIGPPDATATICDYNAHGIMARSEGHRIANLIIQGNELNDLYVGNSECLVVNGLVEQFRVAANFIHDVNNIAIDVIGYELSARETTRFGLVADNVILDASNYWPYCSRGNCTYPPGDESSDGIYVDGGANLEIAYNVIGRTDHGIELQSENNRLVQDIEVHHNAVFNSNFRNWTLGPHQDVVERDNVFFSEPSLEDANLAGCR